MSLERQDPETGRYILYLSQNEMGLDCARYPYDQVPGRVFLDTNVINRLLDWGGPIFEYEDIPATLDRTLAHDIEALRLVLHGIERTSITLFASEKTLEELGNTRDPSTRQALLGLGVEFVHREHDPEGYRFAADFGRRLVGTKFVASLPDLPDQELLAHAIALGCDVFCTCDRRSIIRKREKLPPLPIRILTPVEWWSHTKPWCGLWW